MLELKAIQRSLPTAPQLPDPLARRQQAQYLKGVPIGLLPLYDDSQAVNSVASSAAAVPLSPPPELPPVPSRSPSFTSQTLSTSIPSQSISVNGTTVPSISPLLSAPTTPTSPYPVRRKPNFAFLPLLDTPATAQPQPQPQLTFEPPAPPPAPPSSEVDTDDSDHESHLSTPALSSASLDTTPSPREEEHWDPDYGYFQLPPRILKPNTVNPYFPTCEETKQKQLTERSKQSAPALMTPSPFSLYPPTPASLPLKTTPKAKPQPVEESYDLVINGETYHFGPVSTPPDSPVLPASQPLSPLSPTKPSSPPKYKPFFAFEQERERGQDLPPSISRNTSIRKPTSPQRTTRTRDFHPPSPILAPYCVSMKRNTPTSPVMRPEGMVGGKGSVEH